MTDPRTTRGNDRRAVAVEVARRVLVDDGFEAFGMRRIAELVGMRLGNLQYYFATRDDLLEAVLRAEGARDLAALRASPEIPDDPGNPDDPERHLTDALGVLLHEWESEGGSVYAPMILLAVHDERFATVCREIYAAFYAELAVVVRRVDPTTTAAQARSRAILITALVDGAAVQQTVISAPARRRLLADLGRLAIGLARGD